MFKGFKVIEATALQWKAADNLAAHVNKYEHDLLTAAPWAPRAPLGPDTPVGPWKRETTINHEIVILDMHSYLMNVTV